jgi:hypothetical protein
MSSFQCNALLLKTETNITEQNKYVAEDRHRTNRETVCVELSASKINNFVFIVTIITVLVMG